MLCIHVQEIVYGVKQTFVSNFYEENEQTF